MNIKAILFLFSRVGVWWNNCKSHCLFRLYNSGYLSYVTLPLTSLPVEVTSLVEAANLARTHKSRPRKSGYSVGAAVRDIDDRVVTAGNIENSITARLSTCAEALALLKSDGDGGQKFVKEVAVAGSDHSGRVRCHVIVFIVIGKALNSCITTIFTGGQCPVDRACRGLPTVARTGRMSRST